MSYPTYHRRPRSAVDVGDLRVRGDDLAEPLVGHVTSFLRSDRRPSRDTRTSRRFCQDRRRERLGQSARSSDACRCTRRDRVAHRITLIPGDGIGPEVVEAARRAVEATGVAVEWDHQDMGAGIFARIGDPLPAATLASIRSNGVALKGPVETPVTSGMRSVNLALRRELDLFACVRPCRLYPGVPASYDAVDLDRRPGEHRGHVHRDRVRGGNGRDDGADPVRLGDERHRDAGRHRHLGQDDLRVRRASASSGSRSIWRSIGGGPRSRPATRRTS